MLSEHSLWTALALSASLVLAATGGCMAATSRLRQYPFFFSYATLQVLRSLIELALRGNSYQSYRIYFGFYWTAEAVIVLLNFAVLYEVARSVLRPYPSLPPWVRALPLHAVGAVAALGIVFASLQTVTDPSWIVARILILETIARFAQATLLLLLFALAAFFRLQWKHLSLGIALGFGLYACVCLAAVAMRGHFGPRQDFIFALINSLAYNCACVIWLAYAFQRESAPVTTKIAPQRAELKLADWNRALGGLLRR